jgi:hypothetical protein
MVLLKAGKMSIPKAVDQAAAWWRASGNPIGNAELGRIKRELKARAAAGREIFS